MIEFILPKGVGRKVRLWIDEMPTAAILPPHATEIGYVVEGATGVVSHKSAAIEFFQPGGGSFRYGLLGAEFSPDLTGKLIIAIPAETRQMNTSLSDPLCGKLDQVVIGAPSEYTAAVLAGTQKIHKDLLPSGHITFSSMAHGMIGSSPIVFEMLAKAIIRLLSRSDAPQTADEAAALFYP